MMYKEIYGVSAKAIVVEVEGDEMDTNAGIDLKYLSQAIQVVAEVCTKGISGVAQEKRPDEAEITFGIKALSSGEIAICLKESDASFKIKLKWGQGSSGLLNTSTLMQSFK